MSSSTIIKTIFLGLFCGSIGLSASPIKTIQEAANFAIRNSPEWDEYRAALQNADAMKISALATILPSAELYSSHTELFSGTSFSSLSVISRSNLGGLSITVPLINPQGWAQTKAILKNREAGRFVFNDQIDNLVFRAASALISYIGAVNRIAIAKKRCASLEKSCDGVRTRTAAGDLTTIDLHQAEAALYSAQAIEASLRADSMSAAEDVIVACGEIPSAMASFPVELLTLSSSLDTTFETASLSVARLSKESSETNLLATKLGLLPTVNVTGSSALSLDNRLTNQLWVNSAELRLSLPIPSNPGRILAAQATKKSVESRYVATVRDLRSKQRSIHFLYTQNVASLSLYIADSTATATAQAGRESAFLAGSTTMMEFLIAQEQFFTACENLWAARTATASSGLSLLLITGKIREVLQVIENP